MKYNLDLIRYPSIRGFTLTVFSFVLLAPLAQANLGNDMAGINKACAQDAQAANCGAVKTGTGLLICLKAYKTAQLATNPSFALSANCQAAVSQLKGSGEVKLAIKSDHACSADAQVAGCGSMAVGTGMLTCLFNYAKTQKQQNPNFQFSNKCQAVLTQVNPQVVANITGASSAALYRVYNTSAALHMSTGTVGEGSPDYGMDTLLMHVYSAQVTPSYVPLNRCRWGNGHFSTVSANCEGASGATPDGQLGWLNPDKKGGVPLYRFFNPSTGDHMDSISATEGLSSGYQLDGVLGYGQP